MSAKDNLKKMLLEKSVRTGDFTLASGKKSDLYVDCRLTALDNRGASWIGEVGWSLVKQRIERENLVVDAIGGMTMGADPISLVVGMASAGDEKALQVFNIRKEPKGHGRGKQIEGNFKEGDRVVVVDDVITTGGSDLKAIEWEQPAATATKSIPAGVSLTRLNSPSKPQLCREPSVFSATECKLPAETPTKSLPPGVPLTRL